MKRTNESSNIRLKFQRPNERTNEIRIRTQLFRPVRTVYAGTPCTRTFCTCMRTFLYIVINSILPIRDLRCVSRPRTCSSVLYCSTTSTRCTHDDLRDLRPGNCNNCSKPLITTEGETAPARSSRVFVFEVYSSAVVSLKCPGIAFAPL